LLKPVFFLSSWHSILKLIAMKQALTLSIVIPVYNEQHYLKACLDAIVHQTVPPDEVIVVDNNSTDSTVSIAQKYPFVKVLYEPKQSVLYARNTGFEAVRTDVIGRIDADTVLQSHWVERVKTDFLDTSVAAVTGPVSYYDMPLAWLNFWLDHPLRKVLKHFAPNSPFLFGSNMAIRKEVWQTVKPVLCDDQTVHEDLDLAVHINQQHKQILYDKQLHVGAASRRYEDSWRDFLRYGQMYRASYSKHDLKSVVPRLVTTYYTLGYLMLRPTRALYDPVKRKRSLAYALRHKREAARKNPMAH